MAKKELDILKEQIYKNQFHEENEQLDGTVEILSGGAREVLECLQNLKENPLLLNYLIKCLAEQEIFTVPRRFFYIEVQKAHYDHYEPLAEIQRKEGTPKFIEKTIINKVFDKMEDAVNFTQNGNQDESILYSIKEINPIKDIYNENYENVFERKIKTRT